MGGDAEQEDGGAGGERDPEGAEAEGGRGGGFGIGRFGVGRVDGGELPGDQAGEQDEERIGAGPDPGLLRDA